MSANPSPIQPIEFKGRMILVSILRLHPAEPVALQEALEARMHEAPDLMRDMPVVVDMDAMADTPAQDLLSALETVRQHGLKLIGLLYSEVSAPLADRTGLPLIVLGPRAGGEVPLRPAPKPPIESAPQETSEAAPVPPVQAVHTPSLVVNQPVRSGQQVYARGGDLIITGAVSAGAEVLADGHIHVYGPLRGKALAGVRGLDSARIFCRRLDAELVSIAGHYRIAEDILDTERGDNRLITLSGETIRILEI
ncbi:septum site-determining protein MinC [Ectothiorhodospira variabilis]|uniref:septum site-determining protein MinC n=1 Tax=Ectothiorhodospira variabilis TaxID=505694 RepID=UPI001EFAF94F|nr:septum site-determining protein MinC [Ectothiorhodospira variabilis]MCG5494114.1 septum site-determining protein MinC [Ectothiorhodospira variabilis]MCG5497345.1 septum site-determining protein MinC [Ectothiorhodospira variabilis]MCG5503356.1 septum site-determining protein MinC [Ectothiorhodospira variabilis]MCG5506556.1 septum site-determining protein MinC [Ectothiorhodospira variabilis]